MNAITCTSAVRKAVTTTASLSDLWTEAYAAIAKDVAGGATYRDISDALKGDGLKVSKDLVGDMAIAASLTCHGKVFADAHAAKVGTGRIMFAHTLVTNARTARGVAYVRAAIATLDGLTGDDLAKVMAKVVRELHAAKRETKVTEPTEPTEPTAPTEPETETEPTAPTVKETDNAGRLAAMMHPLEKVIATYATDTPDADTVTAFLAAASRLAKLHKASAETAQAV